MKIIGYIHVCQIGEWKRSYDMIFNCIQNFGLYDNTTEIRLGILSDNGYFFDDERFYDPKIKIVYKGLSEEYERPTLLHMKNSCDEDGLDTKYWYLHTKGLRHFNTSKESFVIDWIKLMLYWNIIKWDIALENLNIYNTYGCELLDNTFYSGNYWWANADYIKTLENNINDYYTAPEEWLLSRREKICCIYSSGIQGQGHYNLNYPQEEYYYEKDKKYIKLSDNFNVYQYKELNQDLYKLSREECLEHYLLHGMLENRKIKKIFNTLNIPKIEPFGIPYDFDCHYYKLTNIDLINLNDNELKLHWLNHGKNEGRKYKGLTMLPKNFDLNYYKNSKDELKTKSNLEIVDHWLNYGKVHNLPHNGERELILKSDKLPNDFDPITYKRKYADLKNLTDEELCSHWLNNGRFENRYYR